ncbi:MAG: sugar transferase [Alphaproteobacteria bacterium]|nr:sugar transferase [Alphaproteobacteria bacterium]
MAAPVGGLVKRILDVSCAAVAIVFLSPILVGIGVVIRRSDGGPAIYAHERIGHGNRLFKCYKFRTMVTDADKRLEEHLANDPAAAREWEQTAKLRDDPRVTWLGTFLRKSSLDELPQFLNVLAGDMSLVGPRPVVADELKKYGDKAPMYLAARPGITGLWQTSGRNDLDYDQRVLLDAQYVSKWSLGGDLKILLATIPAVLRTGQTS